MGGSSLSVLRSEIAEKCTECGACSESCEFLQKYGLPGEIAAACDPKEKKYQALPFECSLCGLCSAVCPASLTPGDMFLEMRREAVSAGLYFPEHSILKDYERRGTSKRFTYYALPEGCDIVLFPGCTLSGTRPERVTDLFHHLRSFYPALGIIFDCCTKPSHDLGNTSYFIDMFGEMREFLVGHGVKTVLVTCPNCYKVFRLHGESIKVKTVYEVLAEKGLPDTSSVCGTVTIHDPCAVRLEGQIHSAVREIVSRKGLVVEEMEHAAEKTLCCGEGGAVGCLSPELSGRWTRLRKSEAGEKRILTYCAGCVNLLGKVSPTSHILDLIFDPGKTLSGKVKVSKAPFTYLNRLRLKKRFRNSLPAKISRERLFSGEATVKKGLSLKPLIFIAIIAVAIVSVQITGAASYLSQENLRSILTGYGPLAPLIYMAIYAIAPALFLPGLPITIVGGILFGPILGVLYTITSSTAGACVAFLISRYFARDLVAGKLRSPRWRRLDDAVEHDGWKVVAFTRLVPLFPFNLLNYAFGLTRIKFTHYAAATFIFMLPACIAFIVFSSSLVDLIKGNLSPAFLIGLGLIIIISLIPVVYKRFFAKRGEKGIV